MLCACLLVGCLCGCLSVARVYCGCRLDGWLVGWLHLNVLCLCVAVLVGWLVRWVGVCVFDCRGVDWCGSLLLFDSLAVFVFDCCVWLFCVIVLCVLVVWTVYWIVGCCVLLVLLCVCWLVRLRFVCLSDVLMSCCLLGGWLRECSFARLIVLFVWRVAGCLACWLYVCLRERCVCLICCLRVVLGGWLSDCLVEVCGWFWLVIDWFVGRFLVRLTCSLVLQCGCLTGE